MKTPKEFAHHVFISYRHNDNKTLGAAGEGWVSEFVSHLTAEVETMVKGKVSIYYDRNTMDGLLENHNVEGSLSEHLKTLIFIPILSRTYCDPDCYAWNNEFLSFLQLAEQDELGATVKLQNGNIAGRVLPICIHDLEQADLRLIESQLDGRLRAINFVFKSPGVNRPLRAYEDDPLKNANKTLYRDQINKVANAIQEIISSVQQGAKNTTSNQEPNKGNLVLDGLLKTTGTVKSIAVMPLVFKSLNPDDEFLSLGFAEDLFSSLRQIKALRLSIHGLSANGEEHNNSKGPVSIMLLTGNMTVRDNQLEIEVQLQQSKTGTIVWHGTYQCSRDRLFSLRPAIITEICDSLSIQLKDTEIRSIEHHAEASAAALELFWKARYHWRRRGNDLLTSLECYQKATDLAPGFADAHAGIANASILLGYYGIIPLQESISKSKESAMKALSIDPTVIEAYYPLAYVSLCYELIWPEAEHKFRKVFDIDPNAPTAPKKFRNCLTQITCTFEESEGEPLGNVPHCLHAYSLAHKGRFEEGLKVAKVAINKDTSSFMAQRVAGICYLGLGYEREAIEALTVAAQLSNRHPWILFDLIGAYASSASNEPAQSIMEEAMEYVNSLLAKINDFFFQPV